MVREDASMTVLVWDIGSLNTADYSLANPDTLTKYKTAAQISHKVLETVSGTPNPSTKTRPLLF